MGQDQRLTFRLSAAEREEAEELAARLGLPVSSVWRAAMREYAARHRDGSAPDPALLASLRRPGVTAQDGVAAYAAVTEALGGATTPERADVIASLRAQIAEVESSPPMPVMDRPDLAVRPATRPAAPAPVRSFDPDGETEPQW